MAKQPTGDAGTSSTNDDPNAGPAADASTKSVDAAAVKKVVQETLGLKDGQNLSHVVASTAKGIMQSMMGETQKALTDTLTEQLAALKPKEKTEEPGEVEKLRGTVTELQDGIKSMSDKADAAEARTLEQARKTAVADILDKANIEPALKSSLRNLAVNGLLDGIPKPVLDDSGNAVIKNGDEVKPFGDVLAGYLKGNPHFVAKHRIAGAGAGGAGGHAAGDPVVINTETMQGTRDAAKAHEGDRDGFAAAAEKHAEDLKSTFANQAP